MKNRLGHSGPSEMETLVEPIPPQPLKVVTVTPSSTAPEGPAVKAIALVPAPEVIVPLPIVQAYVVPAPPDGTEALLPEELGQIDAGAAIAAEGASRTSTLVVAGGETHPSTVTVTA